MNKAPYGIQITTYELLDDGIQKPTLTHIFWGDDKEEALGNAKAHLLTDYFFSSSFVGEMGWYDSVLYLKNKTEIVSIKKTNKNIHQVLDELRERACEVHEQQTSFGILEIIERID
jgi:hypothetical protein